MSAMRGESRDVGIGTGARITRLPEEIKNQIAAGEVIERPASVVKELLENALDAGARHVTVELEEGGARLVRVSDDGLGMSASDLELAFVAHATSKLRCVDDLEHIASLGFRGEALASMGAVARCSIFSRPSGSDLGYELECAGGRLGELREAGGPKGTRVEVRDLFFSTPARRRFLKRTSTELSRCLDVVQRLALAQTDVGFALVHQGRRAIEIEAEMGLEDRVRRVFGSDLAAALVPVEASMQSTRLTGFVAPPRFARRDSSRQMWFLNGRPLRDRILSSILRESYRGHLEHGRQPAAFLALQMDPALVDVNVHPAKAEVRFREERRLFGFCVNALRSAVRQSDMATPGADLLRSAERRGEPHAGQRPLPDPGPHEPYEVYEIPGPAQPAVGGMFADESSGASQASPLVRETAEPAQDSSDSSRADWSARDDFRGPFLQVCETYLVRALPDGLEIVDQHALHERVTYELLMRELEAGALEVQRFLVPELVEVSPAELERAASHFEDLRGAGIELAVFGPHTLAVHGLPARLRKPNVEVLVRGLLDVLAESGRAPAPKELLEELLHSAACRSSVMAGDRLEEREIRALLERAAELECDQTCPHGRPTRVRFERFDLEKAFQRR